MPSPHFRWTLVASVLVVSLGACGGGGGGGKSTGSPDSGAPDAGTMGPDGGGDDSGQVLPPYVGRIVLTPAALLFTDAGQTATLHAQALDATGVPMDATFTFTSSRPDQVAVDATGNVTSMVAVGSTQITVTGAGLTSRPLLVLVAQPQPGTTLISDTQVVAGPTQVDPTVDPSAGAQYRVTLDGVGTLAAGAWLLSREGNPVAGQVVSAAPNGTHTDVIYQQPTLLDLFARVDFQAGYDYTLQTAADDDAIAARAAARAPWGAPSGLINTRSALDIGPFKCKAMVDPVGLTISQSLRVTPNLHFDMTFVKDDDTGDWTDATMVVSGKIMTTGKVAAKLAPGASVSVSCKYQWKEFIPPVAGPLSFFVAPRIPVGVKATIKGVATFTGLELGGKLEESADVALGFSAGAHGTGDIATLNLGDPKFTPIYVVNKDILPLTVELSIAAGPYASINVSALEIGLADASISGKLKYQIMTVSNQAGANTPNTYELRSPVIEVGPGDGITKLTSFIGGLAKFTTSITTDGLPIAVSPSGTFQADNPKLDVPAGMPVTFTIKLDPNSTNFLGLNNVTGVHIYRADQPLIMEPLNEVKYLSGSGPTFTWTWTPDVTEEGPHLFFAAVDDVLMNFVNADGATAPFYVNDSRTQIDVGQPAGGWSGTGTISWTGSGPTTAGGTVNVEGSEMVTWAPGMAYPDGVTFDMIATSVEFSYTETDVQGSNLGACSATETDHVTTTFTLTGADADMQAHGHLTVIPIAMGSTLADYASGLPGINGTASSTSDIVSTCGTSMHYDGITTVSEGDGAPMMGTIKSADTTIDGSTNYTGSGSFGIPLTYTATWHLEKM